MCTRIFWNDNPVAKTVSRTMDWSISDEPDLWALPAGLHRSGGASDRALSWTSAYPSVSLSMWRGGTVDGVNGPGWARTRSIWTTSTGSRPTTARRWPT